MKQFFYFLFIFCIPLSGFTQDVVLIRAEEEMISYALKDTLDKRISKYKIFRFENAEEICTRFFETKQARFELKDTDLPERDLRFVDSGTITSKTVYSVNGVPDTTRKPSISLRLFNRDIEENFSLLISLESNIIAGTYTKNKEIIRIEPLAFVLGRIAPADNYLIVYNDKDIIPMNIGQLCGVGEFEDVTAEKSSVFPNPAFNENIHLVYHSFANHVPVTVEIFDETGKKVYGISELTRFAGKLKMEIDARHFPKTGTYFYKIFNGRQVFSDRFIFSK